MPKFLKDEEDLELSITRKPVSVFITEEAWQKIMFFTEEADGEISGLGEVESEDGQLIITDALIHNQESSAASTTLDGNNLCDLLEEFTRAGKDTGKLRLWWHSHVRMGTSFSGVDTDTMEENFGKNADWMISLCVNKREEHNMLVNLYNPVRADIEAKLHRVSNSLSDEVKTRLRAEMKDKVKAPVFTTRFAGGYLSGDWDGFFPSRGADQHVRTLSAPETKSHPFVVEKDTESIILQSTGIAVKRVDVDERFLSCPICHASNFYILKRGQRNFKCKSCGRGLLAP